MKRNFLCSILCSILLLSSCGIEMEENDIEISFSNATWYSNEEIGNFDLELLNNEKNELLELKKEYNKIVLNTLPTSNYMMRFITFSFDIENDKNVYFDLFIGNKEFQLEDYLLYKYLPEEEKENIEEKDKPKEPLFDSGFDELIGNQMYQCEVGRIDNSIELQIILYFSEAKNNISNTTIKLSIDEIYVIGEEKEETIK